METITLGSGDHKHIPVKAGEPVEVLFSVTTNPPGRGVWAAYLQTFDAPLDAKSTFVVDGGEPQVKGANFDPVKLKPASGGQHSAIVTCSEDVGGVGLGFNLSVSMESGATK